MKRCPQCRVDYFDNALEFCLEDGAKLVNSTNFVDEKPTITQPNKPNQTTAKTVNFPFSNASETLEFSGPSPKHIQTISPSETLKSNLIKENLTLQSHKVLEIAPIFISLAHNWWQWIYLNNQYYSSISSFLISANFLMWLLLLIAGAGVSLLAIKRSPNKAFAFTSLVILSINLILFLVPKR